jgi:hypothetical protein
LQAKLALRAAAQPKTQSTIYYIINLKKRARTREKNRANKRISHETTLEAYGQNLSSRGGCAMPTPVTRAIHRIVISHAISIEIRARLV